MLGEKEAVGVGDGVPEDWGMEKGEEDPFLETRCQRDLIIEGHLDRGFRSPNGAVLAARTVSNSILISIHRHSQKGCQL